MTVDSEIKARLALLIAAGGDGRQLKGVLKTHGSACAAVESSSLRARLRDGISKPDNAARVDQQLTQSVEIGAQWTTLPDHPLVCIQGSIPTGPAVAIVGSRDADEYGLTIAAELSRSLSEAGVTVISGAAKGVDEAAHRSAIESNGRTVAVLGTGLLADKTPDRLELLSQITSTGAVISEYLLAARGSRWSYPHRNQLIASLADATVVVQAAKKSGALITAQHASSIGRPVFAVPGDVIHPLSMGCNRLIAQGKAQLLSHPRDLMSVLSADGLTHTAWPSQERSKPILRTSPGLGKGIEGSFVLDLLAARGAMGFDAISDAITDTQIDLAEVLLDLELKGQIKRETSDSYVLASDMQ